MNLEEIFEIIIKKKNELIEGFLEKLDKIRIYCDKWDYNIPTIFWDTIKEYQKRLKK